MINDNKEHKIRYRIEPVTNGWKVVISVDYLTISEEEFTYHDEAFAWCSTQVKTLRGALK